MQSNLYSLSQTNQWSLPYEVYIMNKHDAERKNNKGYPEGTSLSDSQLVEMDYKTSLSPDPEFPAHPKSIEELADVASRVFEAKHQEYPIFNMRVALSHLDISGEYNLELSEIFNEQSSEEMVPNTAAVEEKPVEEVVEKEDQSLTSPIAKEVVEKENQPLSSPVSVEATAETTQEIDKVEVKQPSPKLVSPKLAALQSKIKLPMMGGGMPLRTVGQIKLAKKAEGQNTPIAAEQKASGDASGLTPSGKLESLTAKRPAGPANRRLPARKIKA